MENDQGMKKIILPFLAGVLLFLSIAFVAANLESTATQKVEPLTGAELELSKGYRRLSHVQKFWAGSITYEKMDSLNAQVSQPDTLWILTTQYKHTELLDTLQNLEDVESIACQRKQDVMLEWAKVELRRERAAANEERLMERLKNACKAD